MTLKPPYLGLTENEVPPTEAFTRPRVVIVYTWVWGCLKRRGAAALALMAGAAAAASHGRGGRCALPCSAVAR